MKPEETFEEYISSYSPSAYNSDRSKSPDYYPSQANEFDNEEYYSGEKEVFSLEFDSDYQDFPSSVSKRVPKFSLIDNLTISLSNPFLESYQFVPRDSSSGEDLKSSLTSYTKKYDSIEYVSSFPSVEYDPKLTPISIPILPRSDLKSKYGPLNTENPSSDTIYDEFIDTTNAEFEIPNPSEESGALSVPSSSKLYTGLETISYGSEDIVNSNQEAELKKEFSLNSIPLYTPSVFEDNVGQISTFELLTNLSESQTQNNKASSHPAELEFTHIVEVPHYSLFNKPIVLDYSGVTYEIDFPESADTLSADPTANTSSADENDGTPKLPVLRAQVINANDIQDNIEESDSEIVKRYINLMDNFEILLVHHDWVYMKDPIKKSFVVLQKIIFLSSTLNSCGFWSLNGIYF